MVFQDPLSSLDPYYAVGDQIAEVYRVHNSVSRRAARARAVEVLDRVGIPDAARRARSRPHEFSGGMRQRALIAMALACEPRLIVADEPTTALDVTVQAQILDLLHDLRRETGMGLLLVTHDVGVAAESVDDILVMRHGRAVERGPVAEVLGAPREPYTRELLASVPRIDEKRAHVPGPRAASPDAAPLLEAVGLRREFGRGGRPGHRGGRGLAHRPRRGDPRHRGGERQRQDDPRAHARTAARPDGRRAPVRGTGDRLAAGAGYPSVPPGAPDGLPGSRRLAQPAPLDR